MKPIHPPFSCNPILLFIFQRPFSQCKIDKIIKHMPIHPYPNKHSLTPQLLAPHTKIQRSQIALRGRASPKNRAPWLTKAIYLAIPPSRTARIREGKRRAETREYSNATPPSAYQLAQREALCAPAAWMTDAKECVYVYVSIYAQLCRRDCKWISFGAGNGSYARHAGYVSSCSLWAFRADAQRLRAFDRELKKLKSREATMTVGVDASSLGTMTRPEKFCSKNYCFW